MKPGSFTFVVAESLGMALGLVGVGMVKVCVLILTAANTVTRKERK